MFFEFDISDVNKNIEDIKDYFYLQMLVVMVMIC